MLMCPHTHSLSPPPSHSYNEHTSSVPYTCTLFSLHLTHTINILLPCLTHTQSSEQETNYQLLFLLLHVLYLFCVINGQAVCFLEALEQATLGFRLLCCNIASLVTDSAHKTHLQLLVIFAIVVVFLWSVAVMSRYLLKYNNLLYTL